MSETEADDTVTVEFEWADTHYYKSRLTLDRAEVIAAGFDPASPERISEYLEQGGWTDRIDEEKDFEEADDLRVRGVTIEGAP